MYATAPMTQLRPEPGTPGESGFGDFATLRINSGQQTQPRIKCRRPDSLDQYVDSVEVEERLERHLCKNEDREYIKMDVRFEGGVAQEFGAQAWRLELWRCRDSVTQAGIRCLGRRKKVLLARVPLSQTLS
jgi:hypothetical protein